MNARPLKLHVTFTPERRRRPLEGETLDQREITQFSKREIKLVDRACEKIGSSRAAFISGLAVEAAKHITEGDLEKLPKAFPTGTQLRAPAPRHRVRVSTRR